MTECPPTLDEQPRKASGTQKSGPLESGVEEEDHVPLHSNLGPPGKAGRLRAMLNAVQQLQWRWRLGVAQQRLSLDAVNLLLVLKSFWHR